MIRAWGITDKGAVRVQNQDSYYLNLRSEKLVVALVCDGMGGARAGNVASKLAVERTAEYLEALSAEELLQAPGEHLSKAAEAANSAIYEMACENPECRGMGTTMVASVFYEQTADILNIGDSRAYQIRKTGIRKLTRDHSVVEDLVQRGDITPEQARTHPQKNLITRALGSERNSKTDLYHVPLESGDFILMCTDGLSNTVTDQELLYEIIHGGEPETCCQRMLDIAISRGAPDNVTAILIQIL